jgi:hypothetical protein
LLLVFNSDLQEMSLQCSFNALHASRLYNLSNHYFGLREAMVNRDLSLR